ncbi:hypothetical protein [Kineothrix alysoides]|nr:hypothetical protein [Kineothrix alysoides]
MRSYARRTKALLSKSLVVRVDEAHITAATGRARVKSSVGGI